MTVEEFNLQFDILFNNVASNIAPGISTYERSVFLTKALEEVLRNYFNKKGNKYKEGFDDSAKRNIDFLELIESKQLPIIADIDSIDPLFIRFDKRSLLFEVPENIMFIINETLYINKDGHSLLKLVLPINYMEYQRLMLKPYKYPVKTNAWKLTNKYNNFVFSDWVLTSVMKAQMYAEDKDADVVSTVIDNDSVLLERLIVLINYPQEGYKLTTTYRRLADINDKKQKAIAEIITADKAYITSYEVRYIRKPRPIIIEDLKNYGTDASGNPIVTINGYSDVSECELDENIHLDILLRAVELAKASYLAGDFNSTVLIGTRIE